jgi:hypothetical protein
LLAFHEEIITGRPKIISVVGDGAKIGLDKLGEIAPVRTVTVEEIFSK